MGYNFKASIEYGKIRATLEKSGKIIGGLEMMISAHTLANKMTLVTNNSKEFERVEHLVLENLVLNKKLNIFNLCLVYDLIPLSYNNSL